MGTIYKGIKVKPLLKPIEGEAPVLQNIELFQSAYALARHSGMRQAIIAQNIANADTPGYEARDLKPFSLPATGGRDAERMIATRPAHLSGHAAMAPFLLTNPENRAANPNGNTISLQEELLFAVEAKRSHDRALAIYQSGLRILRSSLGSA